MKKSTQQDGYIILMSVIIIGAISVAIATSLLSLGVNNTKTALTLQRAEQARALAGTCIDLALIEIYSSSTYVGTSSTSTSEGECYFIVLDTGGDTRTINASSTVGPVVRKAQVKIDSVDPINILSWQEVADL